MSSGAGKSVGVLCVVLRALRIAIKFEPNKKGGVDVSDAYGNILRRINKARLVSNSRGLGRLGTIKYGNAAPVNRVVSAFAMRTHRVIFVPTKSD